MAEARQLSVLEKKVLLSFLEDLRQVAVRGDAGNDYDLPNDSSHQKFMKRVIKTMYQPKDQQAELENLIESGEAILTTDTTVLGYIVFCIERLPTQSDDAAELPKMATMSECTNTLCACYDFLCHCGAQYRYDSVNYHLPTSDNLCTECGDTLPTIGCCRGKT